MAWWAARISIVENEGVEYATIARTWFTGQGYLGILGGTEVMFPPLYSLLLGGLGWVLSDLVLAARIVSLSAGLVLVFAIYRIARQIFGRVPGLVAATITALHPLLVALSVSTYVESLTMALVALSLLFAIETAKTRSLAAAAASGLAAGLAYLTRPETLLFAAVISGYLVLAIRGEGLSRLRRIAIPAIPLTTALLVALPYMVHLSRIAGEFRWEGKTAINDIINGRMDRGMPYARAARGLDIGEDFSRRAPQLGGPELWGDQAYFLRHGKVASARSGVRELVAVFPQRVKGVLRFVASTVVPWLAIWKIPLGALAIVAGIVSLGRSILTRPFPALLLLAFGLLQAAFLLGVKFLWTRYAMPLLPLLIPWMAAGLVWLSRLGLSRIPRTAQSMGALTSVLSLSLTVVLCGSLYPRIARIVEFRQALDEPLRDVGVWILRHSGSRQSEAGQPALRVMGKSAIIPFYAEGFLDYLPVTDDADSALRYIRWKAPDYLVVQESETSQLPYSRAWLHDGIPDRCAVPVHQARFGEDTIHVWKWRCPSVP